ncbi:MAG: DUF1501 domain-containing protein [Terrimicrobiaceae bacterium]
MNATFQTRRHFLRTSFLGGAAAWTVPAFLERTFFALDAAAAQTALQTATGRDHPILVVVQMAGGNDGLNTVIPYSNDAYYSARPRLAVPVSDLLKLDDHTGLHPGLAGLKSLYDEGLAAIVQGVGYPNPNRSHFRSTDIWQTATDADKVSHHGWIGKYFDACCAGEDPTVGVAIGKQEPLAFAAANPKGIAFNQPNQFRYQVTGSEDPQGVEDSIREMGAQHDDENMSGASIGMLSGAQASGDAEDFLRRTALDAQMSSDKVREVTSKFQVSNPFPKTQLGNGLELVARLIAGSMPTRVYYVSQGGYDTHSNQLGTHERLLKDLDAALSAFLAEMKSMGTLDRVVVMTFSEFGRRVAENASGGTDHGAAAPLFVLGGGVRAGLHGSHPSLTELNRGDLIHTTDFRSVYATLLEDWLHAPSRTILQQQFSKLPLLG